MKKKFVVAVAVAICALICIFSFACSSKPTAVDEYNALRHKIITVLSDNGFNIGSGTLDSAMTATVNPTAKYDSVNNVEQIKEIVLSDSSVISDVGIVDIVRHDMYEQALFIPMIVGDGIVNNHNAETMYDTSVVVDCWFKTYFEFKSTGSVTTINSYTPADKGDCGYVAVVYLDFKSNDDYNFVMFLVWEDGKIGYRYGNAQKQFILVDYDPQGDYTNTYVSSKEGEGYISLDIQVVKSCIDLVESQFDGMTVNDYEYLTEQKYTIDVDEWASLCSKYLPNQND